MNTNVCIAFLICVISIGVMTTDQENNIRHHNKLHMSIYYSSRSINSNNFLLTKFFPLYCKFEKYVILNLVPCGRSYSIKTKTHINFECQQGFTDCLFNRVHSCVFKRLPRNYTAQVKYLTCAMETFADWNCIESVGLVGVKTADVQDCALGPEGFSQMMVHELETGDKTQGLIYEPAILFDDFYSDRDQEAVIIDFETILCKKLQSHGFTNVCKTVNNVLRFIENC